MKLSESDWKKFKKIRLLALDRYCTAILQEAKALCDTTDSSAHERYLDLYALIQKRNQAMKMPFDGLSRNSAPLQLKYMVDLGLLTSKEIQSLDSMMNLR